MTKKVTITLEENLIDELCVIALETWEEKDSKLSKGSVYKTILMYKL